MTDPYPPIYLAADRASQNAQQLFLCLNRLRFSSLVVIAGLSGIASHVNGLKDAVPLLVVLGWLLALGLSLALRLGRFDDKWFQCRAIAENVKRLVWQYASGVRIDDEVPDTDADDAFVDGVGRLRDRVKTLAGSLAEELQDGETITEWMRASRSKSPAERLAQYKTARLQDQIDWYSRKAKFNGDQEKKWFFMVLISELLALAVAFVQLRLWVEVSIATVFVTFSATLVAWSQLKRFSDLASAYIVAAEDLRGFQSRFSTAGPEKLSELVEQVEQAISREHRVWLTRRVN
jgi:hypothetical protein